MTKVEYTVMISENFQFDDAYKSGVFRTYEEAVARCKTIINEYLESALTPDISKEELLSSWEMFGENPYIQGGGGEQFNAREYVKAQCVVLTEKSKQSSAGVNKPFIFKPMEGESMEEFKRRVKESVFKKQNDEASKERND